MHKRHIVEAVVLFDALHLLNQDWPIKRCLAETLLRLLRTLFALLKLLNANRGWLRLLISILGEL